MNAQDYWQIFMETGAPELYLMYNAARKMESINVFEGSGSGPQSNNIQ